MKIPIGTVLIFLLNITALQAQDLQPTQAGWDTLRLHLKARKVVAYNTGQVTFLVNYKDFAKEFYAFYRMHKKSMKSYYREKRNGDTGNTAWERMFPAIEAFYNSARQQAAHSDTVYLAGSDLTNVGLGNAMHFDRVMDNGRCIVEDLNHSRHDMILRRRFARHGKEMNDGWGGRLYFLPGSKSDFYSATDWIS